MLAVAINVRFAVNACDQGGNSLSRGEYNERSVIKIGSRDRGTQKLSEIDVKRVYRTLRRRCRRRR